MIRFILILFTFSNVFTSSASAQDSVYIQSKTPKKYKQIIIPSAMILYGVIAVNNKKLIVINEDIHDAVTPSDLSKQLHIDNYLQFTPAAITLGMNMIGYKGKHDFIGASLIYGMSNIFLNTVTFSTKIISHELRPNKSDYLSFPSGHSAEAFASAEFLRMEYKNKSIWFGVLGYSMACATGYLRMYNNKHWFSDVLSGAAVGILSTRLSEWIYTKVEPILFKNKSPHTILIPYYKDNSFGLGLSYHF